MRRREIKKYGDSFVIKLFPIDIQDFNLSVGDTVDIEDLVKTTIKKGGNEDDKA